MLYSIRENILEVTFHTELKYLFEVYTDKEIETLFILLSKLYSGIDNLEKKFCVGASPIENPEIEPALKQNFTESELQKVSVFYCPGGFNYEKMSAPSKLMMKNYLAK